MPRYKSIWCTVAEQERDTLPTKVRTALDAFASELEKDPKKYGTYNKKFDRYTASFVYGLVHYAVVDQVLRIIMLRIVGYYPDDIHSD